MDNTTPHSSSEYDKEVRRTIPYYEFMHEQTIDLVKTVKPQVKKWLDTGCGTGDLVKKALLQFPQCTFYLADPSENMLKGCRHKLNHKRIIVLDPIDSKNISSKLIDAPEVITAILSHHYLNAKERELATENCYSLLPKNGLYITFEIIKPQSAMGTKLGLDRWMHFQVEKGRDKNTVDQHRKRFGKNYFPITLQEHLSLLSKCGFKIVELFWFSYLHAGLYAIK